MIRRLLIARVWSSKAQVAEDRVTAFRGEFNRFG